MPSPPASLMDWVSRTTLEQVGYFTRSSSYTCPNTSTVLITRGLSEMTRIGAAYGASPLTFLGLAGVGDLFLTCSSSASRNYTVGYRLGKGETLPEIVKTLGSVAEGVTTTKALHELLKELGTDVNASIAAAVSVARCSDISSNVMYQVYDILYQSESFCILMD
jgi:glycerol-3-phosphate dehydrogenase